MTQRPPAAILAVFVIFLAVLSYVVAASFARRALPTFAPSPVLPRPLGDDTAVSDTITVDARDPSRWRFLDFDRRSTVEPPDTAGWDLALRRFRIIAREGLRDLGSVPFDSVTAAPPDGYSPNRVGGDTVNPAAARWYRYGFVSHLLQSKRHTYVARTPEGRFAKLAILSYYCPGLSAGCFTLRYSYPLVPSQVDVPHASHPPHGGATTGDGSR